MIYPSQLLDFIFLIHNYTNLYLAKILKDIIMYPRIYGFLDSESLK